MIPGEVRARWGHERGEACEPVLWRLQVSLQTVLTSTELTEWTAAQASVFPTKACALVNHPHLARLAGSADRLPQLRGYRNAVNSGIDEDR